MSNLDLDTLGLAYSGLLAIGGLVGFLKAGSAPSLIAGCSTGAAMAYGIKNDKRIALATSALLLVMMGRRFLNSFKIMPSGIITACSAFFAYNYYLQLFA